MKYTILFFVLSLSGCIIRPEPVSVQRNPVTCAVTGTATICTQSWVMPNHTGQVVRPVVVGE